MKRSLAEAGNPLASRAGALLALALACASFPSLARADAAADFWFGGTQLPLAHPQTRAGQVAVATDDAGLARFLAKLGAVVAYQPGQRYVVLTTADRRTITFALGDTQFTIGTVAQAAGFAPYAVGSEAYLPFLDLARALYVDPVTDGATTVLQPQLAALDVRTEGSLTLVTLRGATALQFKRLSAPNDATLSLSFRGTASTLESDRAVDGSTLRDVSLVASGTARNPTTIVDFATAPGSVYALAPADSPNSVTLAFAPAGVALGGTPVPAASVAAATAPLGPSAAAAPAESNVAQVAPVTGPTPTADGLPTASVTGLDTQTAGDGLDVRVSIAGPVTYEWHRLSDDRWYVDLKPATLAIPPQDQALEDPSLQSLRIKGFVGPNDRLPTVRVALTLPSPRAIELVPTADGLTLAIGAQDDASAAVTGVGELVAGRLDTAVVPLPPVAAVPASADTPAEPWKFTPSAGNGKLIVIDPGHGGSDPGSQHNGLSEAALNLDVSKRLAALLIARGWQVKLTRDSDVDVFGPNASAHDELQARDDVANNLGARLLVSVHTNAFTSSDLNGTTTYYYTAASRPLADAVHARLAASLPTADDGIRKENFYVIHHQTMPGVLIEMAFCSNPGDAKLLHSSAFLQSVAVAIADGIGDYASGSKPGAPAADMNGN